MSFASPFDNKRKSLKPSFAATSDKVFVFTSAARKDVSSPSFRFGYFLNKNEQRN